MRAIFAARMRVQLQACNWTPIGIGVAAPVGRDAVGETA